LRGRLARRVREAVRGNGLAARPVPRPGPTLHIPEFQDLGTNVSEQFSAAIAGQQSAAGALAQAQQYAQAVGDTYRSA
jgi:sorbitol/mannitol transport system substrate-binding protein